MNTAENLSYLQLSFQDLRKGVDFMIRLWYN